MIEHASPSSSPTTSMRAEVGARTVATPAREVLYDITPAPELRIDRYDTIQSLGGFSLSTAENAQLLPMSSNSSTSDLHTIGLGGSPLTTWSSRNASTASLFASPTYANRSRSRSIDIIRAMPADSESGGTAVEAPDPSSMAVPARRQTSGLRMMFPKRTLQASNETLPLPTARREALRNRDISAPLADTLVRTSTTYT